jgi:6,7-dimethyl-8-ribityllumazine synthase
MQGANKGTSGELAGTGLRIGIVQARFNAPITDRLAEVCLAELAGWRSRNATSRIARCPARWKCRWR